MARNIEIKPAAASLALPHDKVAAMADGTNRCGQLWRTTGLRLRLRHHRGTLNP